MNQGTEPPQKTTIIATDGLKTSEIREGTLHPGQSVFISHILSKSIRFTRNQNALANLPFINNPLLTNGCRYFGPKGGS